MKHSPREARTMTKMLSGLSVSRFSMGMRSHRVLFKLGHEPRWQACSEMYCVHPSLFTEFSLFYWRIPCTMSRCRGTPHLCRAHTSSSTGRHPDITFVWQRRSWAANYLVVFVFSHTAFFAAHRLKHLSILRGLGMVLHFSEIELSFK